MSITHGRWLGPFPTPGEARSSWPSGRPAEAGIFVIHAVLLRNGKVYWMSGGAETAYLEQAVVWDATVRNASGDPDTSSGNVQIITFPASQDLFCCHHVQLPDGKILFMGGASHPGGGGTGHGTGIRQVSIFDPTTNTFAAKNDMSQARWYPTPVLLGDGRVVVFSGRTHNVPIDIADQVEVFAPGVTYNPVVVTVAANTAATAARKFPTYPSLHLVRGGKIFHTGTNWRYEANAGGQTTSETGVPTVSFQLNSSGTSGSFRHEGNAAGTTELWSSATVSERDREEGTSILLSPAQDGKILVIGGGRAAAQGAAFATVIHNPANAAHQAGGRAWRAANIRAALPLASDNSMRAAILDTQASPPTWTNMPGLSHSRINVNAVNLVDGKVLILGGHNFYKWAPHLTGAGGNGVVHSLPCEIFDPVARTFTVVASLHRGRMYHSAALLLPDATVIVAGGANAGEPHPTTGANQFFEEPEVGSILNQKSFEIYEPTYLFIAGTRPTITTVKNASGTADEINYGRDFFVETPQVNDIAKVVLIRPGSMTHHTDSEQRHIPFTTERGEVVVENGKLKIRMLVDPSIAPPGYYMVFLIDNAGRVCVRAKFALLRSWVAAAAAAAAPASSSSSWCFVATAVYGTAQADRVDWLRFVRDELLPIHPAGKVYATILNSLYYKVGPAWADFIRTKPAFKWLTRQLVVSPFYHYSQFCWQAARLIFGEAGKAQSLAMLAALFVLKAILLWVGWQILLAFGG